MDGRRERLRASMMDDVRAAALAELRRTGPANLSLREVARQADISPAGLYRYVDGRDGLLELLIADGFDAFGTAIREAIEAAGADLSDQLSALCNAYHGWALANREQFALILGSPVAGFQPRPVGPTIPSAQRFGQPMLVVFARAYADGRLGGVDIGSGQMVDLTRTDPSIGEIPSALLAVIMRCWGRVHGVVSLDVFGHLEWSGLDIEALLRAEVSSIIGQFTRS